MSAKLEEHVSCPDVPKVVVGSCDGANPACEYKVAFLVHRKQKAGILVMLSIRESAVKMKKKKRLPLLLKEGLYSTNKLLGKSY